MVQTSIVFYTCVTGGYDRWWGEVRPGPDLRYVHFSDTLAPGTRDGWDIRPIPEFAPRGRAKDTARFLKMHPHRLFPDFEASVYVDGNVFPRPAAAEHCRRIAREHALSVYRHPFRDCVHEEARECARLGLIYAGKAAAILARYEAAGYPRRAGLLETNVLIRRHHDARLVRLMAAWWREYESGVGRDQLSLPYLLWRERFPHRCLGESDPRHARRYFDFREIHGGAAPDRYLRTLALNAWYRRLDPRTAPTRWLASHEWVARAALKLRAAFGGAPSP